MNTENALKFLTHYAALLPVIGLVIVLLLAASSFVILVFKLVAWRQLLQRKVIFLELTPPASVTRTPNATQQLFSVIHGQRDARSLKDKLLRREIVITLEMASSRQAGVRYIIQVEHQLVSGVQQAITSYLPDVKVAEVTDFLPDTKSGRVIGFKQTGHYAFPLASHDILSEHDPVAYLAGAMTKLNADEFMSFQLVLTPVRLREAGSLSHKILGNEDLLTQLGQRKSSVFPKLFYVINTMLFGILDGVSMMTHTPSKQSYSSSQKDAHDRLLVAKRLKPARTLSVFEQQRIEAVHDKVSQPLFRVDIRALIAIDDKVVSRERIGAVKSSLASYSVPSYQGLQQRTLLLGSRYNRFLLMHRLPSLFARNACTLSASEVANLYHFPLSSSSRTDNLVTSLSRTLPAPLSLKQDTTFDLILGRNYHHGTETDICLSETERERHVYIIGGTGNGKTTMLQNAIVQDMNNGKGLAVVDPHGDMAETILRHVPQERVHDVIYFNPDDLLYPIGLNLLEITPGLTGVELMREKDLITESVISVFRKIFSDEDSGGHRIEYVLRNTIQTALTVEDATLFTIFSLLNDPKYRKKVTGKLENPDLVNFWKNELGKAGEFQRVKMSAGITSKIGRFLFSASAKQILEQPRSTINFDDILNSGKILICNLSKGLIGEDTSELFGITILAKLQLASLRRARIQQSDRRPFYLYVDEFQNFATASFVQMLSEARKYKLFMLMAEQSTSQQKDQQMVSIILANVGTVVCFRTGNPQDERLLLPLFSPYINAGEIADLSAFSFYAKLAAMKSQEPLSGQTILLVDDGDSAIAGRAIELSREHYAVNLMDAKSASEPPEIEAEPAAKVSGLYGVNPDEA